MLLRLLFCIFIWITGSLSELYDVTTIYRIDEPAGGIEYDESPMSAEIHARTNALGLPFLVAGNVVEPEIGVEMPRCVALRLSDIRCEWELDNWDWTVWESAPLLDTGDWSELKVTEYASKYMRFDDALFIRLHGLIHNQSYIHLVFTPNRAYIQNQEKFYYLQLSRLHQSFFLRCDNDIFERFTRFKDLDENIISVHCHRLVNITQEMERWTYGKVNAENFLLVEINKNGTIQIWNTKTRASPIMKWIDSSPIPINFFTIRTDEVGNTQVSATNYGKGLMLSMSKNVNVATITSPPLSLASSKICVSIVYHTYQSTTPTVLSVSSSNQTVHLGELKNDKDGWKVERFKATLPESMVEEDVKVHIKSVKNEGQLEIQRIAGCNAEDDEDIATISVLGGLSIPSERVAYNVAIRPSIATATRSQLEVGECENGGLMFRNGKCACPAGFTGDRCQIGCGANRYGQDCGGLCSLREQACRGLTLCTPILGCFCAPGYKGYHCNQTCEGRQYGAGCTQRCNNCAGHCDIYTGICTTVCKPGFYPPFCKTLYSYTQFSPQVSTSQYGEAVVTPDLHHILGQGKPAFYQVQYKVAKSFLWLPYSSLPITHSVDYHDSVVLEGLQDGVMYDVRIILIDQDLNSYQGSLVPYNHFLSKCFVPEDYDYKVTVETTDTTIIMSWVYKPDDEHSCPVVNYELSWQEGWRWLSRNVSNNSATLIDKLPVTEYRLRVRALTSSDYAPFSDAVSVRTKKQAPGPVSNLTLVHTNSTSLVLSWSPPEDKDHYRIGYVVTYECERFAACENECGGGGEAHVLEPQISLHGLQPLAQYLVTVAAVDGTEGRNISVVHATLQAAPTEVVRASAREPLVTDNSLIVFWESVDVCTGFFLEYAYQMFGENDFTTILSSGTTKETFAVFGDLEAKRAYKVKVFIVSSGGWSSHKFLWINVTTKASAPEAVQHLTVYKSGRQLLGLRWARPAKVFGDLKQFLINYRPISGDVAVDMKVEPVHCNVWPLWYCYTLSELTPDTSYSITVRARNSEVLEYGPPCVAIEAVTSEKAPEKPTNLQVLNITSNSFALSWGFPLKANGILRSFLVTVAETERVDYEQCCKPFPNIEIPVTTEQPTYETEIVGLNPASTYAVSVTGKTIMLGPPESLTVHTRPPRLAVGGIPTVELPGGQTVRWLPQDLTSDSSSAQIYLPLIRGSMLVMLTTEERNLHSSGISDKQLFSQLKLALNSSFFVVTDYRGNSTVKLDSEGSYEGFWGSSSWIVKELYPYRLAAVQVAKYFKSFSTDVVLSEPFELVNPVTEVNMNNVSEAEDD